MEAEQNEIKSEQTPHSMTIRRTVKKDGTLVVKSYDQTNYNKNCYMKNKERYNKPILCKCGKTFSTYTKSNHYKSQIHRLFERMNIPIVEEEAVVEPEVIRITFPVFD